MIEDQTGLLELNMIILQMAQLKLSYRFSAIQAVGSLHDLSLYMGMNMQARDMYCALRLDSAFVVDAQHLQLPTAVARSLVLTSARNLT